MRTTLTLDEDVAIELERLCRSRNVSFKELVNNLLRRGLRDLATPSNKRKPFRTRTFRMGQPLTNIDNTAETLANLEGEAFK